MLLLASAQPSMVCSTSLGGSATPQADSAHLRAQHTRVCPTGHPHGVVTLELASHSPLLAPREGHRDAALPPVLVSAVRHPGHAPLQEISTGTKLLE